MKILLLLCLTKTLWHLYRPHGMAVDVHGMTFAVDMGCVWSIYLIVSNVITPQHLYCTYVDVKTIQKIEQGRF